MDDPRPRPAKRPEGPYETERNPDTFEIADGCYRRLPCAGSDDAFLDVDEE